MSKIRQQHKVDAAILVDTIRAKNLQSRNSPQVVRYFDVSARLKQPRPNGSSRAGPCEWLRPVGLDFLTADIENFQHFFSRR